MESPSPLPVLRRANLAQKVAFLAAPASYPEGVQAVEAIETHMSWVFLTERHAYKLKKPERIDHLNLASVSARERHCRLEVRLNRRFSDDVYLGLRPLRQDEHGELTFAGAGRVVDWLIRMRRLPAERMMDAMIRAAAVQPSQVRDVAELLARFYALSRPEPLGGAQLRAHLAARIAACVRELAKWNKQVPVALVEDIGERQIAYLEEQAELFDRRAVEGRIVEGHGDLRPEHICLEPTPRIIDCLEFDRELRLVDPAEELGFLSLEGERLGAPWIKAVAFEAYAGVTGDRPEPSFVHFYQSCNACVRARLAMSHLLDAAPRTPERWPVLARDYLRLAAEHISAPR